MNSTLLFILAGEQSRSPYGEEVDGCLILGVDAGREKEVTNVRKQRKRPELIFARESR